jgi:uncharacterized protein YqjF (DUF2071 family)
MPVPQPSFPVVMWQRWERLLFLHWEWSAAEIQKTLPPGLEVDLFQGRAFLGLIPFVMRGVRPRFCPPVPGLSDFLEMNVRTYVRDQSGRAGVWFYSLDCTQPVAVAVARTFFHLPYFRAVMTEKKDGEGTIRYTARRRGSPDTAELAYTPQGVFRRAAVGSLEEFLVERYRLFAGGKQRLWSGQVWHLPYEFSPVELSNWSELPLQQAGFAPSGRAPDHQVFAGGVSVAVHPLEKVPPD